MEIQEFHDSIVEACLQAGYQHIPYSSTHNNKVIPGWNDYVEPYRKQALLWHKIWKSNNSPRTGIIADIRNKTRLKYHYALRYVKMNSEVCKANKLAEALATNTRTEFWNIVRKIRQNSSNKPGMVDNASNPVEIADVFAAKY